MLSKCVTKAELGKIFSLLASLEAAGKEYPVLDIQAFEIDIHSSSFVCCTIIYLCLHPNYFILAR